MPDVKIINKFPSGIIKIPPSKSVAHRAIICAGLCGGESIIENVSLSQDITATINCMKALGISAKQCDNNSLRITGGISEKCETLDCGESGSTLRFLIPVAATTGNTVTFTGHGRLLDRPLTPYYDIFSHHGVTLTHEGNKLTLSGKLTSGVFELAGNVSSQFISGLLFALPTLQGDSEIRLTTPLQSASYVNLTIDALQHFGIEIQCEKNSFSIKGNQTYKSRNFTIEGDYSQAAFFLVASAIGSECECSGLDYNSKQGDRKILDILKTSGIELEKTSSGIIAKLSKILPQTIDVSDIPDLVPPLAVLLSFGDGTSNITNAGRLRIKESDRLHTVTTQLNQLGANIIEGDDFLTIHGVKKLRGGLVSGCNDHRIAMMCAVAGIKSTNPVILEQSECVAKSYKEFWQDFEKVARTDE